MGLEYNFLFKEKINEDLVFRRLLEVKEWNHVKETKFAFRITPMSCTNIWQEDFFIRIEDYVIYVCVHVANVKVLDSLKAIMGKLNLSYELEEL
jgi:hypothetical protein